MRRLSSRALRAAVLLALLAGAATGCRPFWRRGNRPPFRKVAPAVAYEIARDSPDILIVDLRRPDEYQGETGHIANALNFPLDRLPDQLPRYGAFREETFLVYCRGNDRCDEDGMALLVAAGFEDAILIDGGIDRWIRDGFKTVITVDDAGQPTVVTPP